MNRWIWLIVLSANGFTYAQLMATYSMKELQTTSAFNARELEGSAITFCQETVGIAFATMYIGTDVTPSAYANKGMNHPNYENWAHNISFLRSKGRFPLKRIAEVNRVGRNCGLRVRNERALYSKAVVGQDPLAFSFGGCQLQLMEYLGVRLSQPAREGAGYLAVFFHTDCSLGSIPIEAIYAHFRELAGGTTKLQIKVRNDEMFPDDEDFPVVFAFGRGAGYLDFIPPSSSQWEQIKERVVGIFR